MLRIVLMRSFSSERLAICSRSFTSSLSCLWTSESWRCKTVTTERSTVAGASFGGSGAGGGGSGGSGGGAGFNAASLVSMTCSTFPRNCVMKALTSNGGAAGGVPPPAGAGSGSMRGPVRNLCIKDWGDYLCGFARRYFGERSFKRVPERSGLRLLLHLRALGFGGSGFDFLRYLIAQLRTGSVFHEVQRGAFQSEFFKRVRRDIEIEGGLHRYNFSQLVAILEREAMDLDGQIRRHGRGVGGVFDGLPRCLAQDRAEFVQHVGRRRHIQFLRVAGRCGSRSRRGSALRLQIHLPVDFFSQRGDAIRRHFVGSAGRLRVAEGVSGR